MRENANYQPSALKQLGDAFLVSLGPYKFCITILSYDFLSAHLFAGILPGLL